MISSKNGTLTLGRVAAMIPVRDIEKSYRAYSAVFGFEKVFENGQPVGFMILRNGAAELHLTLQKTHKPARFNVATCWFQTPMRRVDVAKQKGSGSSRGCKTRTMA